MKNLNTILPFYDDPSEQYRFKKGISSLAFLISKLDSLPPWIIRRETSEGDIHAITVTVIPCNGGTQYELHGDDLSLEITPGSNFDFIAYTGRTLPSDLPYTSGGYYLDVYDGYSGKHWYSEIFSVRESVSDCVLIEFYNETELGNILSNFSQSMYVDSQMVAPIYIREDEGEKRDGILVKEKQVRLKAKAIRWEKLPEYMVDALIRLEMQDVVSFTVNSEKTYTKQVIIKDPEWTPESYGLYAKLEIQLVYEIEIKKLNFKETEYGTGGYMSAIIKQGGPVLTVANGDYYEYQVVFSEDMSDANYTPTATAVSTGEMVDAQDAKCTNITIHGFLITTTIECSVRWTAIKV